MKRNRKIESARIDDMDEEQRDIEIGAMLGLIGTAEEPPRTPEQEKRLEQILKEIDEEARQRHERMLSNSNTRRAGNGKG